MAEENGHHCKLEERMNICERKISDMDKTSIVLTESLKSLSNTVTEIRDGLKWLNRTILGAVVLAILGLVLTK